MHSYTENTQTAGGQPYDSRGQTHHASSQIEQQVLMRPGGKRPIDQSDQCPPIPPSSSAQHGLASLANVGDGCAEEEFFGYSNISSDSLFKSEHKIYGGGPVRGIPHNSQRPSRERSGSPLQLGQAVHWRMRGGAGPGGGYGYMWSCEEFLKLQWSRRGEAVT